LLFFSATCSYGTFLTTDACNECGKTDNPPNLRIVGGTIANKNSWPAQALIVQSYKIDYDFGIYGILTISQGFKCGGTLINRQTILTAAHCISNIFEVNQFNRLWKIKITPNNYYPTWESMFKVYLGAHNISFLDFDTEPTLPTIVISVKKIIVVCPRFINSIIIL
jgi:hypothetical protein